MSRTDKKTTLLTADVRRYTYQGVESVARFPLEVLSKSGNWDKSDLVPGSFVVNIADCFMQQANDFLISTVHRVVNRSGKERYSARFVFGFDRENLLEPVPTCVSAENPTKYPVIMGGEYYKWESNKQKSSGAKTEEKLVKK